MDICIEYDEESMYGDMFYNFGVRFKDDGWKKILSLHLLGSFVINGRFSWKTLTKPNLKNALYNSFVL